MTVSPLTSKTATPDSSVRGTSFLPVTSMVTACVVGVTNCCEFTPSTPSETITVSDGATSAPCAEVPSCDSSLAPVANMRTGPTPSASVGCWRCGSHLTHCHDCWFALPAATISDTSVGACHVTSCATIANATLRHASSSPTRWTARKPRRSTASGTDWITRWVRMKRRNAPVVSGSRSSMGCDSGGVIRFADCWRPTESRTEPKSSASGRRSHMRIPPTTVHRLSGAGCR